MPPRSASSRSRLLGRAGVRARGEVYEGGPLEALDEALGAFTADEVVVCTDEPLDADRVRTRSGGPVTYLTGRRALETAASSRYLPATLDTYAATSWTACPSADP